MGSGDSRQPHPGRGGGLVRGDPKWPTKIQVWNQNGFAQMYPCTLARWWQQMNIFYFQPYLPGEDFSNLTRIFFRWVGSTTN